MIYLGTKFHEDRLRVITVEKKITKPGSLTYKGRPLVRSGNTIYYGDMGDKYVAMLQILSEADFDGETLPTKVSVQIWSTDEELRPRDRVVKKTEKNNLFDAMNIASIWLERQLGREKSLNDAEKPPSPPGRRLFLSIGAQSDAPCSRCGMSVNPQQVIRRYLEVARQLHKEIQRGVQTAVFQLVKLLGRQVEQFRDLFRRFVLPAAQKF